MPEALYRGMDRAEIDRQLNLRARWPEHTDFLARWARDSEIVRAQLPGRLDLSYGPTVAETLDLFAAPGAGPAPLLAFIHGGYWQMLDKNDFSYLAPPFVESGIAFASLNYELAPKARIGEIVAQVRKALAWLHRHAAELGLDPERIFAAGHSAGGHLAVMALLTDWAAERDDGGDTPPAGLVKGACAVSGIYELEPIRLSYHQQMLRLDPPAVTANSPLRLVPARAGPLLLAVGDQETPEFRYQQDELARLWRGRGLDVREVALPGRHHFSAVDALGERDHALFAALRDLVLGPG